MATLTTNISNVSLTVSGTTTQSTTLSWTCPTVPSGATINSCTLTGTATASMSKGSATIKVNGTTVSSGSTFTINLGTSNTTSSVTATAVGGNKNASGTVTFSDLAYKVDYSIPLPTYRVDFVDWNGTVLKSQTVEQGQAATAPENPTRNGYEFIGWDQDFSNVQADMFVTALYEASMALKVKENSSWTTISKIYKKIAGTWVEQPKADWHNVFSSDTRYKQYLAIPTAILYSDGTLVFYNNASTTDSMYGDIVETYTGWDTEQYSAAQVPWYNNRRSIVKAYGNFVTPCYMDFWFVNCSSLTSLDLSNFDTSNVTDMGSMFYGCSSLTSLNVSSFDMSNVTNTTGMFGGCTNLQTIYVKDQTTKTKIESSYNFPTTATVVIGSPN